VGTAESYLGGGYEVRTSRCSYLSAGSGEQMANASARLLCQLAEE